MDEHGRVCVRLWGAGGQVVSGLVDVVGEEKKTLRRRKFVWSIMRRAGLYGQWAAVAHFIKR